MPAENIKNDTSVIELSGICKSYSTRCNTVHALKDVSMKVKIMNIIGCLDEPDSGSYRLCGSEVCNISERRRGELRRNYIGFVFQSFNLIPSLSAIENVELPMIYRRVPASRRRKLALQALEEVGLSPRATHRPQELSGGQQQRVAIARAVAMQPGLILADEPTGSLDRSSGEDVLGLLRRLNAQGVTIVLITHDPEIAARAGRIVTVSDGRVK